MKKLILTVSLVLISCLAAHAQQSVTLSTYYPAPFGSYDRLRLVPRVGQPPCDASLEGLMYYSDDPDNFIKICHSDGTFRTLAGIWTQDNATNSIYPSETPTNPNLKVGIGTTTPQADLHIKGDGHLILEDTSLELDFIDETNDDFRISGNLNNRLEIQSDVGSTGAFTSVMTIQSNGNVGIGGITNPLADLHIGGDGAIRLEDSSAEIEFIDTNDDDFRIFTKFPNRLWIDSDVGSTGTFNNVAEITSVGGVGIGTRGAIINDLLVLGPYPHPADGAEGAQMNIRSTSNVQWGGSILHFSRSRGVPGGLETPVLPGDLVGAISSWANTGGLGARIAAITMEVDAAATVNPTSSPGRILFKTTPNGAMQPTTRMMIDKDGKVGIGTTAPDGDLHVNQPGWNTVGNWAQPKLYGDFILSGADPTLTMIGENESSGLAAIRMVEVSPAGINNDVWRIQRYASGASSVPSSFHIGYVPAAAADWEGSLKYQKLTILPNGNVGIGTTNPQDGLHVVSNAVRIEDSSPEIFLLDQDEPYDWRIIGNDNRFRISSSDNNDYHNSATWDNRFFIDGATGNVGIGMNATGYKLDVNGTIHSIGADLAENILVEDGVGPGDVVVIAEDDDKKLKKSDRPYDPKIAGVISTDPGFCLAEKKEGYQPLALTGQVPVKATTENGPIKRGDLLTSSSKPGYAMKAEFISLDDIPLPELSAALEENRKRQLAIIGKALEELAEGEGTIVILMTR